MVGKKIVAGVVILILLGGITGIVLGRSPIRTSSTAQIKLYGQMINNGGGSQTQNFKLIGKGSISHYFSVRPYGHTTSMGFAIEGGIYAVPDKNTNMWIFDFKEAAGGHDSNDYYGALITKQEVRLIKQDGDFYFMANTNDYAVEAAFPYSGKEGLVRDLAIDTAEYVGGELSWPLSTEEFAYELVKTYNHYSNIGNGDIKFSWVTYGDNVGHFTLWHIEIPAGGYAIFKVISTIYTHEGSLNIAVTIKVVAPNYSPSDATGYERANIVLLNMEKYVQ